MAAHLNQTFALNMIIGSPCRGNEIAILIRDVNPDLPLDISAQEKHLSKLMELCYRIAH